MFLSPYFRIFVSLIYRKLVIKFTNTFAQSLQGNRQGRIILRYRNARDVALRTKTMSSSCRSSSPTAKSSSRAEFSLMNKVNAQGSGRHRPDCRPPHPAGQQDKPWRVHSLLGTRHNRQSLLPRDVRELPQVQETFSTTQDELLVHLQHHPSLRALCRQAC